MNTRVCRQGSRFRAGLASEMSGALFGKRAQLLLARFAGSGLQLAMTLALTRTTDPAVAASCLVQFSWVQLMSAAMAWGHPITVLRDASGKFVEGTRYSLAPHWRWIALVGLSLTALSTAIAVLSFPADLSVVALVGASALGQALVRVTSQALKAFRREVPAILLEFSLVPLALTATILCLISGGGITPAVFAVTQAVASALALIAISLVWLLNARKIGESNPPERVRGNTASLHYLGVLQLMSIGTAQLPIVLAPSLLPAESVASFVVAYRVASLVTTVQNALNGYYGPRYGRSFARADRASVSRLLKSSQLAGAVLCAPVVLVAPWAGSMLAFFGPTYSDAALAYAILAVGQFVNAVTGLVSYVLSLSHRERTLVLVNTGSLLILVVGWGFMWVLHSTSLAIYCTVFSAYLIAKNVVNYGLARHVIRSMPDPS